MNGAFQINHIQNHCRVCFRTPPDMLFSCFNRLMAEGENSVSYNLMDILNLIMPPPQNQDQFSNLFPTGLCVECKNVVMMIFQFKINYERTTKFLQSLFVTLEQNYNTDNSVPIRKNGRIESAHSYVTVPASTSRTIDLTSCTSDNEKNDNSENRAKKNRIESDRHEPPRKTEIIHLCPYCQKVQPDAFALRKHARRHQIFKKYFVGKKIKSKTKFYATPRKTVTIFNQKPPLPPCPFCKESIPLDKFQNHMFHHISVDKYTCDVCHKIFQKIHHLKRHKICHMKEFPFNCKYCKKGFVVKENLKSHLYIHTGDNLPYKCNQCEQSFPDQKRLFYHTFIHTENRNYWVRYLRFSCRFCKGQIKQLEFEEHLLKEHNLSEEEAKNEIKRKRRGNGTYSYKARDFSYSRRGIFTCQYCSKTFRSGLLLREHVRQHTGKELCFLCGARVWGLEQHLRFKHEKRQRKKFKCSICDKVLATNFSLVKHIRTHTGERPFQCHSCGKVFKDNHTMTVHQRIHIGIKKFPCPLCDKRFLEKSYMYKHLKACCKSYTCK